MTLWPGRRFKTGTMGLLIMLSLAGACSRAPRSNTAISVLDAALWVQQSAEYKALARQTYQLAKERLSAALNDPTWTAALEQTGNYAELPPAVILDVDETILETTTYSAQLIRENALHNEDLWSRWYEDVGGKPVPGAVDFCRYAREKGITIFYVTNNKEYMKEIVRRSLKKAGFPLDDQRETLLTRTDVSDKGSRRATVAGKYRILLLIGDDANDFASGFSGSTTAERARLAEQYASYWGTKWIVLPNPMYGSWEAALFDNNFPDDQEERITRKIQTLEFELSSRPLPPSGF